MTRHLGGVGLFVVVFSATAAPGYLSVVGPPPLRFAAPPVTPSAELIPLPPLTVIEPRPPVNVTGPATPATSVVESNAVRNPIIDPPAVHPSIEPVPADPNGVPMSATAQTDNIVPQMFLKYFTGNAGTNGPGVSIYSPVGFIPPQPVAPPSSSSAFQTAPPPKP